MSLTTLERERIATKQSTTEHSGLLEEDWAGAVRSDWAGTPLLEQYTALTLQASLNKFATAFGSIREHDMVQIVTTIGGHELVRSSVPRGTFPSKWVIVGQATSPAVPGVGGVDDAVRAVHALQAELGWPLKDVLVASDVRPRTFHSWRNKSSEARPHTESVRGLWNLADFVAQLRAELGEPVGKWLRDDDRRRALLLAHKFDELMDLAEGTTVRHRDRDFGDRPPLGVGVGDDVDPPQLAAAPAVVWEIDEQDQ